MHRGPASDSNHWMMMADRMLGVLLARAVPWTFGPFLVLRIRMGVIARPMLNAENHNDLTAMMFVKQRRW